MEQQEADMKQTEANTEVKKDNTVWRISEFAKQVGKHINTVDNWFKQLESNEIHYINRLTNGEKVYDTLDLKIGLFIKQKREEKWSLDAIFDQLPARYPCREFPVFQESERPSSELVSVDDLTKQIQFEVSQYIERKLEPISSKLGNMDEYITKVIEDTVQEKMKILQLEMLKSLPVPLENQEKFIEQRVQEQFDEMKTKFLEGLPQQNRDSEEERHKRIDDVIILHRVRVALEKEALNEWLKRPENERYQQVGFIFKKQVEDAAAKQVFINEYVNQHFEEKLKTTL